jgi:hypothetical protein
VTRFLIGLVLVALAAYGALELRPLLAGPALVLAAPGNGASFPDGIVNVEGRARRASSLTLNGAPLFTDEAGAFETELAFPPGGSILTLTATDRFGRRVTRERMLYIP